MDMTGHYKGRRAGIHNFKPLHVAAIFRYRNDTVSVRLMRTVTKHPLYSGFKVLIWDS